MVIDSIGRPRQAVIGAHQSRQAPIERAVNPDQSLISTASPDTVKVDTPRMHPSDTPPG
jgi:hypothetical protein